jgi:type IV fimbrial biogenesis protein FimT
LISALSSKRDRVNFFHNRHSLRYQQIMRSKGRHTGFTLIELLVTIAIAAIVLGIAVPSFNATISSNRLTTRANELMTALSLARSEAIKRGVQVTVRRKSATSTQWEEGWDVFADSNGDNDFDDDGDATLCETGEDCLLSTFDALPGGYTLRTGGSAYKDYAAYLPSGLSKSAIGDTFTLCSHSGTGRPQRTIILNTTGRARATVATGTCP